MKNRRFHIAIQLLLPVIFAGLAALATIVAYQTCVDAMGRGHDARWPVALGGILITGVTFALGYVITWLQLQPVKTFVERVEPIAGTREAKEGAPKRERQDEATRFRTVFNQVADLLESMDARAMFPEIIGQSEKIRGALALILKVAPSDASVLILGESGTGKELAAEGIHRHSRRRDKPFMAINSTAIPQGLLESELMGHEKGSFTGATERKIGKFEAVDGGTVFLDEIADMPLETQARLLRVLETQPKSALAIDFVSSSSGMGSEKGASSLMSSSEGGTGGGGKRDDRLL